MLDWVVHKQQKWISHVSENWKIQDQGYGRSDDWGEHSASETAPSGCVLG